MILKSDFIKAISANISDNEKKDAFLKKNLPSKNTVATVPNSPNYYDSLKEKSFFDMLITNNGLNSFCDWMVQKCIGNKSSSKSDESRGDKENPQNRIEKLCEGIELEEYQVLSLFQEIYSEVFEYKIYELFEIYEYRPNLKIGTKEIYLIITFSAALDSHQVLEFIFLFGNLLYGILSGGNELVYGVRIRQFTKLIGFTERHIGKIMKEMEIFDDKQYDYEGFQMLLFILFEEKDIMIKSSEISIENNKIIHKTTPLQNNKKELPLPGGKYKNCKGLCNIF